MRKMKFKAWSPSKKEWREGWSISCYEKILHLNHWQNLLDDDLILSQYTGLEDRTRKEIFENDIVYIKGNVTLKEGVIIFRRGEFIISHNEIYGQDLFTGLIYSPVEIIGNTFENPELLK